MERDHENVKSNFCMRHKILCCSVSFVLALFAALYTFCIRPPAPFPTGTIATISRGSTLKEASQELKAAGALRSPLFLELYIHLLGGAKNVIAGGYALDTPQSVFVIGRRIVAGDHQLETIKITIPEGTTIVEIAALLRNSLASFSSKEFMDLAAKKEGFLFPDTYFFLPTATPEEILTIMEENFAQKLSSVQKNIDTFHKPLNDVIIMASIIEKEAHAPEARKIISGILWKRLEIGMPLQVDATFLYINGKKTFELSLDDLAIDSPYNTYKNAGLPAGPIGNPGLDSIVAAVTPTPSPYLYYLADKSGETHYAKTFDEHKRNKERYLQ